MSSRNYGKSIISLRMDQFRGSRTNYWGFWDFDRVDFIISIQILIPCSSYFLDRSAAFDDFLLLFAQTILKDSQYNSTPSASVIPLLPSTAPISEHVLMCRKSLPDETKLQAKSQLSKQNTSSGTASLTSGVYILQQ